MANIVSSKIDKALKKNSKEIDKVISKHANNKIKGLMLNAAQIRDKIAQAQQQIEQVKQENTPEAKAEVNRLTDELNRLNKQLEKIIRQIEIEAAKIYISKQIKKQVVKWLARYISPYFLPIAGGLLAFCCCITIIAIFVVMISNKLNISDPFDNIEFVFDHIQGDSYVEKIGCITSNSNEERGSGVASCVQVL
ncbi:hypothetical protein KC678_00510 [Candidatus Dojkabacteria bacterium]|uniref:Uncharacterized protein n=1 Tax=Candidatus Dojkabacteria bacterium TaxID=2099670 RepID=A0A955L1G6_9BACT|nr:hypothetical protein [Candidatus Dojkabacteria bacterium]